MEQTPNPKCTRCKCYWKPNETDIKSSGLYCITCKKCREYKKKGCEKVKSLKYDDKQDIKKEITDDDWIKLGIKACKLRCEFSILFYEKQKNHGKIYAYKYFDFNKILDNLRYKLDDFICSYYPMEICMIKEYYITSIFCNMYKSTDITTVKSIPDLKEELSLLWIDIETILKPYYNIRLLTILTLITKIKDKMEKTELLL